MPHPSSAAEFPLDTAVNCDHSGTCKELRCYVYTNVGVYCVFHNEHSKCGYADCRCPCHGKVTVVIDTMTTPEAVCSCLTYQLWGVRSPDCLYHRTK